MDSIIEIADYKTYLQKMGKSILDKAFFLDKIFEPIDTIVDFGCADGSLIQFLMLIDDSYKFIGYDNNPKMIEEAKKKVPTAEFTTSWSDISTCNSKGSLINLSSVLHEIYSYCSKDEINDFWSKIFNSNFSYICIRDMMMSEADNTPVDETNLAKLKANKQHLSKLEDYEKEYGKITKNKDFVHFLLKYQYDSNWERELRESYLSLSVEAFKKLIPSNYEIVFFDSFTLPYQKWSVKKDFDIDLNIPTHIKCILKRI